MKLYQVQFYCLLQRYVAADCVSQYKTFLALVCDANDLLNSMLFIHHKKYLIA